MKYFEIFIQSNEVSSDISEQIEGFSKLHVYRADYGLAFRKKGGTVQEDVTIEGEKTYELKDITLIVNRSAFKRKSGLTVRGVLS